MEESGLQYVTTTLDWFRHFCGQCTEFAEYDLKPTLFTYSELQKATRDFHVDMKLGEGGYGAVYKVPQFYLMWCDRRTILTMLQIILPLLLSKIVRSQFQ